MSRGFSLGAAMGHVAGHSIWGALAMSRPSRRLQRALAGRQASLPRTQATQRMPATLGFQKIQLQQSVGWQHQVLFEPMALYQFVDYVAASRCAGERVEDDKGGWRCPACIAIAGRHCAAPAAREL